jgi:pimeloyl-ACP methyl ester carboxylesterase
MSLTRRTALSAAMAAATLPIAASAQSGTQSGATANTATGPVRNVVLVHGAFADGSGWRGVHDLLTQRGYRVSIVQNPLTSLADDVAATRRVIERADGPVILVGHSWGGTVITEAGADPKVAGLVYVSAFSPDVGETTAQQYDGYGIPAEFVIDTHGDGFGFLRPENFKAGFAADLSDADAAFLRDSQVPIAMSAFSAPTTRAAWRDRPSWAVIATEDKAIHPRMLRAMASRIGAKVTEVAASHVPFVSQPQVVAGVIEQAAQGSTRPAR